MLLLTILFLDIFFYRVIEVYCTEKPLVVLPIIARNKEHTLPYYLAYIDHLDYPKNRIAVWIRSDHNVDDSQVMLSQWSSHVRHMYHSMDVVSSSQDTTTSYPDESQGPLEWTPDRYHHLIAIKEEALHYARKTINAQYILFTDCDNFINHTNTLNYLIEQDKTVISPMLVAVNSKYSNYWTDMDEEGYYTWSERYDMILNRTESGCLEVPMIHSTFLINLSDPMSNLLTFNSRSIPPPSVGHRTNLPVDDIITFAYSAKRAGILMYICNEHNFGTLLEALEPHHTLDNDAENMLNLKLENMGLEEAHPMPVSEYVTIKPEPLDTLGFDKVFLINLHRRPIRRHRMLASFAELAVNVTIWEAVDGSTLNTTYLESQGIKMLPQYEDPYHKRPMKMGEFGCFLSHYNIWKQVVESKYESVVVFEDDIRFEPYFRNNLHYLMYEVQRVKLPWDLIYLGRKRLVTESEPYVSGTDRVVEVGYSYWTLSYIITAEGARKLINGRPLERMVPVDEYIPIMFNRHPNKSWSDSFPLRDLRAYSAAPLLVHPTHYTGQENYISDTEDSLVTHTQHTHANQHYGEL